LSTSQVTYPIVAALVGAEAVLGPKRCWTPSNTEQEAFLSEVFEEVREEVGQGIRSLESDYSLQGDELSVKGVLDLLVKWVERGSTTKIKREDQQWEGVRLTQKGAHVRFWMSGAHHRPIVEFPTQTEDVLYMTMLAEAPDHLQLRSLATALIEQKEAIYDYGGVCFPMVDLRHNNDVSYLVGMQTPTDLGPTSLVAASQETKLRMNEVGAHIRSEFRGTMLIGAALEFPKPDYTINRPFLLVFTRPGLKQPLAVLYITEEDWKNPGTLDFD